MGEQESLDLRPGRFRVGDLTIDTGRQHVERDGNGIALPKLSYDLLITLVREAPNLVSNDTLMGRVWPKLVVSPETVSQRVKLLRDALGDDPRQPRYIEGLRGRGYRLVPAVEPLSTPSKAAAPPLGIDPSPPAPGIVPIAPPAGAAAPPAAPPEVPSETPPLLPPVPPAASKRARRVWPAAAVAAAAVLAVGFVVRETHRRAAPASRTSIDVVAVQPRVVAVLPFDNLSTESANEYIAKGMAESVLNRLGSSRELVVIARSSSFALGKSVPDAREAGRRLGAGYIVEGSVQRSGAKLRVNAQLIDANRDTEMWSLSLDRTVDDVFAVQDEIAQQVADRLAITLRKPSADDARFGTEAYLELLKGRALLQTRKVADLEAAIGHFSRALDLAPTFSAALTDLAYAKYYLASVRGDFGKHGATLQPEIRSLADRAIQLDPAAGAPYYLRAELRADDAGEAADAEADFRRAFDLAPNYALGVYSYGSFLLEHGRAEQALGILERAILLDPLAPSSHYLRGEALHSLGRSDEAAASYQQAIRVAPDYYPALVRLAITFFFEGRLADAIELNERSLTIEPKANWSRERLIWFYVHLDDLAAARDVLRGFGPGYGGMTIQQALLCYRAGNLREAEALARSAVLHDPDTDQSGVATWISSEAVVERALAERAPDRAREFLMAIPGVKKEAGRMAIVDDNWPLFVQLAGLERQSGNLPVATEMARGILDFADRSVKSPGPAGVLDWTRASALAILGRNDEALGALERMVRAGNHMRWFVTFEGDPNFAALHATPKFQALGAQTQAWLRGQQERVRQMRQSGLLPPRVAGTGTRACDPKPGPGQP